MKFSIVATLMATLAAAAPPSAPAPQVAARDSSADGMPKQVANLASVLPNVDIVGILRELPAVIDAIADCASQTPAQLRTTTMELGRGADLSSLRLVLPDVFPTSVAPATAEYNEAPVPELLKTLPLLISAVYNGGCPSNATAKAH